MLRPTIAIGRQIPILKINGLISKVNGAMLFLEPAVSAVCDFSIWLYLVFF